MKVERNKFGFEILQFTRPETPLAVTSLMSFAMLVGVDVSSWFQLFMTSLSVSPFNVKL